MPLVSPLCLALAIAAAQVTPGSPEPIPGLGEPETPAWRSPSLFLGGALAAFLAHESGHAVANLSFGATPHLESVSFAGAVPFFSVTSDITCSGDRCTRPVDGGTVTFGAGRRGLFTILMAGFHVQHATDEVILTLTPRLRYEEAPLRKGMLAFNTLTSAGYVLANWVGLEPEKGDLHGTYAQTGAPRHLVNGILLGVAALDLARYAFPDVRWLAWASRVGKVGLAGLTFTL